MNYDSLRLDSGEAMYTVCADETGMGGESPYVIVTGALSLNENWNRFEKKWDSLLSRNGVHVFHATDFKGRTKDYSGWSNTKRTRFSDSQTKIIKSANIIEISVAVESLTHAEIKKRMKGIKGYWPRSDYGLCFSFLRVEACRRIAKAVPDAPVYFVVEDAKHASGAERVYADARKTVHGNLPAPYAHMLAGFARYPKGHVRGLEAADYLAMNALDDMRAGKFNRTGTGIRIKLTPSRLESWYEAMTREKARRRERFKSQTKK